MSLIELLASALDKQMALKIDQEALQAAIRVMDEALASGALGELATSYLARRRRDIAAHQEALADILAACEPTRPPA